MRIQAHDYRRSPHGRPGYVLIAVLIVIVVLSLAAYRYSDMMMAEYRATDRILKSAEAKAMADSGVHYAAALLADKDALAAVGNPYNSTATFRDQSPDAGATRGKGRFSVVSFDYSQEGSAGTATLRYGVADESGRLNVNALVRLDPSPNGIAYRALAKLPNMTDAIAYAIIDWVDADDNTSPDGAEDGYYTALSPSYHCKSAPLDSVEELLLVKGVTPTLLFGNDLNRNGVADPEEQTGGEFGFGWAPYLTVYSREQNVDAEGNPRVNLNGSDIKTLYADLKAAVGDELAAYLVAYRTYDLPSTTMNPQQPPPVPGATADLVRAVEAEMNGNQAPRSRRNISSVLQLIGSQVSKAGPPGTPSVVFAFPVADAGAARDLLPKVLDKTTTKSDKELPGRVNVNTAPRDVLKCLPGLEDADVDAIITNRPAPDSAEAADEIFQTPAWLYTEANLPVAKLQALEQYVTARTQVYRFQSVGHFEKDGPVVRVEAVVDTNQGKPRVLYYRDLSELGRAVDPRKN